MRYECMRPGQIRQAIAARVPVVLALGVLEYHAEHLPLNVDTRIIEAVFDVIAEDCPEMVILPSFHYGCASHAVTAQPLSGNISIDSGILSAFAEELFANLLRIGFRNIHGFVYHQSENFQQGMPTDLAFRLAGRRAVFAFQEQALGQGWWGRPEMKNYYQDENVFDWIQIHPLSSAATNREFPPDHAGKNETSFMLYLSPELVDMDAVDPALWYAASAREASAAYGNAYFNALKADVRQCLALPKSL